MLFRTANLSQLAEFDEIIDVRTPAEFADDHIPGAINCPVLSDEERIVVGTLYKQASPFEARKVGGALVAKNIAHHLETRFHDLPKSWKPLVYCWRGGQRSGAMSIVLSQIGWAAHKLDGGYKSYRHDVLERLDSLPAHYAFRVICGPTGTGKSRLLTALAQNGHQVLDLEALAQHRGSVLGKIPQHPQPSQKWFDSLLLQTLRGLDPSRPIYVESESRKIGTIALPTALCDVMHASPCLLLEVPLEVRITALLQDYRHYIEAPESLMSQLQSLLPFHGNEKLAHWNGQIRAGDFSHFVAELLTQHYDPTYFRSLTKHYPKLAEAQTLALHDLSPEALCEVAKRL